jgi:DNA polymerase-1
MAKKKISDMQTALPFEGDMSANVVPLIRPANDLPLQGDYRLVTTVSELEELADAIRSAEGLVSFDTEFSGAGDDVNVHLPGVTLVGLSFAVRTDHRIAWYVPLRHKYTTYNQLPPTLVRDTLAPLLMTAKTATHNGQIDISILAYNGWGNLPIYFDTYAAAHTLRWRLEPSQAEAWAKETGNDPDNFFYLKALKELAKAELGRDSVISFKEVMARSGQKENGDFALVSMEDALTYVCQDADLTLHLAEHLEPLITDSAMEPVFRRITMPLLTVLSKMERRGYITDNEHYGKMISGYQQRIAEYDDQLQKILGRLAGWRKDSQVRHLLYTHLKLPVLKRTKTGLSAVGKDEIAELITYVKEEWEPQGPTFPSENYPIETREELVNTLRLLQNRAKLVKLTSTYDLRKRNVSTFTYKGRKYGKSHPSFNASGTDTGRKASNTQNVPARDEDGREVRNGIIALPTAENGIEYTWYSFVADLSQIEPRCMAFLLYLLGDDVFLDSYRQDKDVYLTIGSYALNKLYEEVVKKERNASKILFLAIAYGASAAGLASNSLIEALGLDKQGVQRVLDTLFGNIPGIKRGYHWNAIAWGLYKGYTESLWGFPRPAKDLRHPHARRRADAVRAMVNHVIQSFAAQVIDSATVWIDQLLVKYNLEHVIQLYLQVHDELDPRVRSDYMEVARTLFTKCMSGVTDLGAPLKVDIEIGKSDEHGSRWGDLEPYSEYGVQSPETEDLIQKILAEESPFKDMPLSDMAKPFDMSLVPDDDLPIYLWHAANLGIPLDDPRIPLSNDPECVTGYVTNIRSYKSQGRRGKSFVTHRGTVVSRNVITELYSRLPLTEGYYQLHGFGSSTYDTFDVQQVVPLTTDTSLRNSLRSGAPITISGFHIRTDLLRAKLDTVI